MADHATEPASEEPPKVLSREAQAQAKQLGTLTAQEDEDDLDASKMKSVNILFFVCVWTFVVIVAGE